MSAASAATRASLRRFSSWAVRHAMTLMITVSRTEMSVTSNRNNMGPLSQLELDRDLHDDIDRRAQAARRREAPLPDGLDGAIVQPGAQALQNLHVADRSVAAHDDFEHDFAARSEERRVGKEWKSRGAQW